MYRRMISTIVNSIPFLVVCDDGDCEFEHVVIDDGETWFDVRFDRCPICGSECSEERISLTDDERERLINGELTIDEL